MVETLFILILYMKGVPLEYMGHHDVRGQWQEMGMAGCLGLFRYPCPLDFWVPAEGADEKTPLSATCAQLKNLEDASKHMGTPEH